MSMDCFAAGANAAYLKRKKESAPAAEYTMERNAFADVIAEQRAVRAQEAEEARQKREAYRKAEEEKYRKDEAEMQQYLNALGALLEALGRPVKSWYINPGGERIVAHRETESVSVMLRGGISDRQKRWNATARMLNAVLCTKEV